MLNLITLNVIDKIFNEKAECKLSGMAQMIYINCLMHHFRDKPAKVSNAIAFELSEDDFKNFDKYKKYMIELQKAGLITIGKKVVFNNVWGQLIDRSKLEKVKPDEFVGGFVMKQASQFKDELLNNESMFELMKMKHKIRKPQAIALLELFIKEQDTLEKKYCNLSECLKHYLYWAPGNADKAQVATASSQGKILGMG